MFNLKSIKSQLILYLACFAAYLAIKDQDFLFCIALIIAVISSVITESAILYFKTKAFQVSESSVISGLIVGYVLSSDMAWWKLAVASALAIISKYLISFRKKHIFNPAAFGIFFLLLFLNASTQWKGTYLWYIIIPFGFYFAQKARKLEIIISYFVVSLILFGIQGAWQKFSFWNIFGFFSYFYIFVMVIEPMTSPVKPRGKYFFGAGIAVIIFILTEFGARFDVELLSLLVMNAFVPLFNKLSIKKERK